jgi:hypothetical protein
MHKTFDPAVVRALQEVLDRHPVYGAVRDLEDLRLFMSHHVYSVWDFMSMLKYLQYRVTPAALPWAPTGRAAVRRFINALGLEEESDEGLPDRAGSATYTSHFELYCRAMGEVGADLEGPRSFVALAREQGVRAALEAGIAPAAARAFMATTFDLIEDDRPHRVAAAFALGREHIIPGMFRALLKELRVSAREAPALHYYLHRHIHLDEDFHAPLSLLLLDALCAADPLKLREAEEAACEAIEARIRLWDGVLASLQSSPSG